MSVLRRLRSRAARDLVVAALGHGVSKGLGILAFIVMTRTLEPAEYGVFMLAYSVFEIALYLSDLGLDTGTTRFASKSIRRNDERGTKVLLTAVFVAKLVTSSTVFVLAYALAPGIAGAVLARPEMTPYLRIALVGVFGMQLSGFYQSYFGSALQFFRNAVFSSLAPLVILTAVLAVWWRGTLDVITCLRIYAWTPLAICILATAVLGRRFLTGGGGVGRSLGPVWRFSRWIYLTNALSTVRFRLNSILLARLATFSQVGLYNYGDKLAAILTLFTNAITTVFVPRASHLTTRAELRRLLRLSYRASAVLLPVLMTVPLASRPLIRLLAPGYVEAAPIFALLFLSILFSLASLPSATVLYSVNRPNVETAVEALALLLTFVVGGILIRSHGATGAAWTMLLQRAVSASLVMGWVYATVYRAREGSVDVAEATELEYE